MNSVLVDLGFVQIHWYGVMMALGFLAALGNWIWLGRTRERSPAFCSDLLFWIMVSGIIGARLAYIMENWNEYAADPLSIFKVQEGGLVFYGGFVGSALALVIFARLRGERLVGLIDFVLTSVPLAHALGRVGCFLNGCCFGRRCDGVFGVHFPALSPPWWAQQALDVMPREGEVAALVRQMPRSLPVHPVQLYEALANLLLYAILVTVYRRRPAAGWVMACYMLLYPVARFALETFRGDRGDRVSVAAFSIAQLISAVVFVSGICLAVVLATWQRRNETA